MSADNSARIRELMTKYTFHVDDNDSLKEDFTCIICKKLLIDAFHSFCGCQYCQKCITEYLSHEERHCPGNNADCHEEYLVMERNVTINVRMNRQILKLRVKCPNESCEYKAELCHMEEHIRVCQKQAVNCPYIILGCEEEESPKDFITSHLNVEVFRHSDILIKYILNFKNEFDNLKMDFEITKDEMKEEFYKKEARMKEQDDEIELLKNESNDLKVEVEELKKEIVSLKEESEMVENNHQEMECLSEDLNQKGFDIECLKDESEKNKKEVEELKNEIISLKAESKKVENIKHELDSFREKLKIESENNKVEVEALKEEIISLKAEFKKMKNIKHEFDSFREKSKLESEKNKMEVEELKKEELLKAESKKNVENKEIILKKEQKCEKVKNIAEWINSPNIKVDFIWRIDGISKKINQNLFSEPFYSNNYKLRLYYYYYDYYDYPSWGFSIMRGDNDDRAEWPLRLSVTLSTMNQVSLRTQRSETLKYDTHSDKGRFERPKNEQNDVIFGTIISENDHSLSVFEDSLIIYCVVTPP